MHLQLTNASCTSERSMVTVSLSLQNESAHTITSLLDHRELAPRDPVLIRRLQLPPEIFRITATRDCVLIEPQNPGHGSGVIVEEFGPQVLDPAGHEARQVLGRGLTGGRDGHARAWLGTLKKEVPLFQRPLYMPTLECTCHSRPISDSKNMTLT